MHRRRWTRRCVTGRDLARDFGFLNVFDRFDALFATFALFGFRRRCLGGGPCRLLDAERFHSRGFDARGFGRGSLLRSLRDRGSFGSGSMYRRLLLCRGGNVRSFATTTYRFTGDDRGRFRNWLGRGRCRGPTTTCRRSGSRLLFGAGALLALPSRADASDLIVREQAHVTANGYVHRSK
jgi:hypothetical protein